ncbi:MAG: hypothetical protein IT452_06170 [Planctomycetia bacterium]|nr:hypothetical protein [Planctomycetia bacterium]
MKAVLAFLTLALVASLGFSGWAINDLRNQVQDLEGKVASLSDRPQAPAPAAANTTQPASASPQSGGSTAGGSDSVEDREPGSAGSSADGQDPTVSRKPEPAPAVGSTVRPEGWTEADRTAFEKEVYAALEKREKEREARQDARQAEWMTARLKEQLKLTDQQAAEIGKIVTATMADIEKIRSTMTPENREEIRPQIQASLQAADTQVKSLLTAEQATTYDEMKKNGGGLGFGGGGRRRGGPGGGGEPQ